MKVICEHFAPYHHHLKDWFEVFWGIVRSEACLRRVWTVNKETHAAVRCQSLTYNGVSTQCAPRLPKDATLRAFSPDLSPRPSLPRCCFHLNSISSNETFIWEGTILRRQQNAPERRQTRGGMKRRAKEWEINPNEWPTPCSSEAQEYRNGRMWVEVWHWVCVCGGGRQRRNGCGWTDATVLCLTITGEEKEADGGRREMHTERRDGAGL